MYQSFLQSPFDVVRTVFAPMEGERELTLNEKSDLFFHDYSMASLFVQENYVNARPHATRYACLLTCPSGKGRQYNKSWMPLFICNNIVHRFRGDVVATLKRLAKTADSLCDGDLVERKIRSSSNWGLLPLQVHNQLESVCSIV